VAKVNNKEHIYIISKSPCGPVKIGISRNPVARRRELQGGSPYRLMLMDWWTVPDRATALTVEKYVLDFYSRSGSRMSGEWINVDCFSASVAINSVLEAMFTPAARAAA
jgi:hypothetical protein